MHFARATWRIAGLFRNPFGETTEIKSTGWRRWRRRRRGPRWQTPVFDEARCKARNCETIFARLIIPPAASSLPAVYINKTFPSEMYTSRALLRRRPVSENHQIKSLTSLLQLVQRYLFKDNWKVNNKNRKSK